MSPVTRQTVLPTSSAISSAPDLSIARPTGRPRACSSLVQKSGDDVLRHAVGLPVAERHEDHLVAIQWIAIPAAVFADKGAAAISLRQAVAGVERMPSGATCELSA